MALPHAAARSGADPTVRIAPTVMLNRVREPIEEAGIGSAHSPSLKLAIDAPPENGHANADLIAMLADLFGLQKRDANLAAGASRRRKLAHVADDPERRPLRVEEGPPQWLKRG
jgi:uncharacterized protein YggU (UPF0235/DUF167 family)